MLSSVKTKKRSRLEYFQSKYALNHNLFMVKLGTPFMASAWHKAITDKFHIISRYVKVYTIKLHMVKKTVKKTKPPNLLHLSPFPSHIHLFLTMKWLVICWSFYRNFYWNATSMETPAWALAKLPQLKEIFKITSIMF